MAMSVILDFDYKNSQSFCDGKLVVSVFSRCEDIKRQQQAKNQCQEANILCLPLSVNVNICVGETNNDYLCTPNPLSLHGR